MSLLVHAFDSASTSDFALVFAISTRASRLARRIRGSVVVHNFACHAEDPGSIPGRGVFFFSGPINARAVHVKWSNAGLNRGPCGY